MSLLSTRPALTPTQPGAGQGYIPLNTLGFDNRHQPLHKPSQTYGSKVRHNHDARLAFLDEPPDRGPHVREPDRRFSHISSPNKRRKVQHHSNPSPEVIDLDTYDDPVQSIRTPAILPPNPFQASSPSEEWSSGVSQRTPMTGRGLTSTGDLPASGFMQTNQAAHLRQKKPRRPSIGTSSRSLDELERRESLDHEVQELASDDYITPQKTSGNRLKDGQGGVSRATRTRNSDQDELQSSDLREVRQHVERSRPGAPSRTNRSIVPPEAVWPYTSPYFDAKSKNLREFRRAPDPIEDDNDELTGDTPNPSANPISASSLKSTSLADTATRRQIQTSIPAWPLKLARCHDLDEQGDDLGLKYNEKLQIFQVQRLDRLGVTTNLRSFAIGDYGVAEADDKSRIRLRGPKNSDGYLRWFHLQFKVTTEFLFFCEVHVLPSMRARRIFLKTT